MSKRMDDASMKPLPRCERCNDKIAVWRVSVAGGMGGFDAVAWFLCTPCAKTTGGARRGIKPSDY